MVVSIPHNPYSMKHVECLEWNPYLQMVSSAVRMWNVPSSFWQMPVSEAASDVTRFYSRLIERNFSIFASRMGRDERPASHAFRSYTLLDATRSKRRDEDDLSTGSLKRLQNDTGSCDTLVPFSHTGVPVPICLHDHA
jgi:hypothetical protein